MKVIQMKPSHVPVLNAVVKHFNPRSCVECGSGNFSTGILSKIETFHTIEHSSEWAEHAIKSIGMNSVIVQPISGVRFSEYPDMLSSSKRKEIAAMYRGLAERLGKKDLVFIDSYAGVRDIALAVFWKQFDVAILHDTQHPRYGYGKVINRLHEVGMHHIQCMPKKEREPWTDIIISKDVPFSQSELLGMINSKEYPFQFKVSTWI